MLRLRAASFGELLAEAGLGLAELLLHGAEPRVDDQREDVAIEARDREAVLVDWLNELLYLADVKRWVPSNFDMWDVSDTHVAARLSGTPVAESPALVKAATFHGLTIREIGDTLSADVTLDV